MRIKGWMGRADQTAKVKGMFVHPRQVAEVAARHPELRRLRLVVGRAAEQDTMTLDGRMRRARRRRWKARWRQTLQSVTKLKGAVKLVAARRAAQRRQGDRRRAPGGVNVFASPRRRGEG